MSGRCFFSCVLTTASKKITLACLSHECVTWMRIYWKRSTRSLSKELVQEGRGIVIDFWEDEEN